MAGIHGHASQFVGIGVPDIRRVSRRHIDSSLCLAAQSVFKHNRPLGRRPCNLLITIGLCRISSVVFFLWSSPPSLSGIVLAFHFVSADASGLSLKRVRQVLINRSAEINNIESAVISPR